VQRLVRVPGWAIMKSDMIQAVFEMTDAVEQSRIQRIRLLDPHTLLFELYGKTGALVLAVSLKKGKSGFHLLFEKSHPAYLFESPAVNNLYSIVRGQRIERLHCFDRCICMALSSHGYLVFDFRVLNIAVFDADGRAVFRFFKGASKAGEPDLQAYTECIAQSGNLADAGAQDSGKNTFDSTAPPEGFTVNRELSSQFYSRFSQDLVQRVMRVVRGERKKVARLLEKLGLEAKELENRELFRTRGELLKYNLTKLSRGDTSVTLQDFGGRDVEIQLDPALNPTENMKRYFAKYRKLGRKKPVFEKKYAYEMKRLKALDRALLKLSDKQAVTLQTSPAAVLELLEDEYFRESLRRRIADALLQRRTGYPAESRAGRSIGGPSGTPGKKGKGEGFLRFVSGTGKAILVGKNARANEELAIRRARGNDLWFHVEGTTGSTVLLRYDKKSEFQERDILDAAMLALYFSRLRGQGTGDVVYTYCKYIKKPKGTKPGYVIYYRNKTRHMVLDDSALARLIDSKIPITSDSRKAER
jgi:predicted ribosome quality control (RQC) complex YloA/Tae2 family protein